MMFLTHLLGGIFSIIYFGGLFGIGSDSNEKVVAIMVAAVFALLPDIDMVKSKAGRKLQPFSTVLSFVFRHRGFLHSFIFTAAIYFIMSYLFSTTAATAAAIGYSSHLLLDAFTKEGIMPLSPLSKLRLRGFIKTAGILEKGILLVMVFLLVLKLV